MTNRSKIKRTVRFLLGVYLLLLQTAHAEEKTALCWRVWAAKGSLSVNAIRSNLDQSAQRLRERFFPTIGYFDGPVLDRNDTTSIRQALSVSEGDGAAIVDINPFTPEIAEKVRQAIHDSFISKTDQYSVRNGLPGLGFNFRSYEEDWGAFRNWLLSDKGIISSEEVDQFRREMDEYLHQVKQTILKTDGRNIELKYFVIRTDRMIRTVTVGARGRMSYFVRGDRHISSGYDEYHISASIAPVGWSTYYVRSFDERQRKLLSRSGHTLIMSEKGRIRTLSEQGDPTLHGTPGQFRKRLFILSIFELSD